MASPTAGIINALSEVQLNIVGCGFFPNEATIICQGFEAETGQPFQRPGKTVSTAVTLTRDTNADGIADSVIALTAVTTVNCNQFGHVHANNPGGEGVPVVEQKRKHSDESGDGRRAFGAVVVRCKVSDKLVNG